MTLGDPVNINLNKTKKGRSWYIGTRYNPQFAKPYYVAYGQLSKAEAKRKEGAVYGSMSLTGYATLQEYESRISELLQNGFRVHQR